MAKSLYEKYAEMIQEEYDQLGINSTDIMNTRQYKQSSKFEDDEESEDFLTSKEIVKMKENEDTSIDSLLPNGPVEIEEDVHFKRYTKRREHKYTEQEMDAIRKSCENVIVHDFSENDIYHMTDEERSAQDSLNELALKLGKLKRLYRQVDEYIIAMRVVVEAWELLEKKENYIHTSKEFWDMIADGRIYHNRIITPKLKGIDKYNKDLIIQYISNPELDPKDLIPKDQLRKSYDDWDEDEETETEEEELQRLLSPEEVQYIFDHEDAPEEIRIHEVKNKYVKNYSNTSMRRIRKKSKGLKKKDQYIADNLHDILKKIENNPRNRKTDMFWNRSSLITQSMFEKPKEEKDIFDDLFFDGSWASKDDLFLYDLAVREEMLKQHMPGTSAMTYADKELSDVFNAMEQEGMNVTELRRLMNMSSDDISKRDQERQKKNNRKIESALIQRITKLNHNPKFKKLIAKTEKAISQQMEEY